MVTITHNKTNTVANWTQAQLDAQIALGNFAPGTLLADIVLPSDWNDNHTVTGIDGVYVPYSGATNDVNLDTFSLTAKDVTTTRDVGVGKSINFVNAYRLPLVSNVNDFDPDGHSVIIFDPDSKEWAVTGVKTLVNNAVLIIYNQADGAGIKDMWINHEDANSSPENRFELPNNATLVLDPQEGAMFIYDTGQQRWVYIGRYIPEILGTDNQVLYKSGKNAQGSSKVIVDAETNFTILPTAAPTTPTSGVTLYANDTVGRGMIGQVGVNGDTYRYQPFGADRIIKQWVTQSGVTAVNLGLTIAFTGGTSTPVTSSTNYFTSQSQAWLNVAAAANSISGGRHSGLLVNRGNGSNTGGFYWAFRGGGFDAAAVANARNFVGLWGTNGFMTNLDPSAQTNILGFGWDTGDANMQFFHNDNAGVATKVNLGAGFPANTNNADWYKHEIWCYPSGGDVYYKLTRYTATGVETSVSGSVNTNIPATTTYMSPQIFAGNGTTALARRYAMGHMYLETNY
jgi:hypothetical protein